MNYQTGYGYHYGNPPVVKGPEPHPPLRTESCEACGICKHTAELSLCNGCKVVWYCSSEHQQDHLTSHEPLCSRVQECQKLLEAEDSKLKDDLGVSVFDSPDVIIGHLCPPEVTDRDHPPEIRTRKWNRFPSLLSVERPIEDLVDALIQISTTEAHEAALHLCRSRYLLVPAWIDYTTRAMMVLLRLGREQECYDLLEWRRVNATPYWNRVIPPIDTTDSDPFEVTRNFPERSFNGKEELFLILQLLNIRRLVELHALQYTGDLLPNRLPPELISMIKGDGISPLVRRSKGLKTLESNDHSEGIEFLWRRIRDIHFYVREHGHITSGLAKGLIWTEFRYPNYWYPRRGSRHNPKVERYILALWAETSIAFEVLADLEYYATGHPTLIQQMDAWWQDQGYENFNNHYYDQRFGTLHEDEEG
ncbi:hypothetical protein F4821DRAFT_277970 [Hypoxylon rubiginosum]|uniref:Uncharacterized protein n=1 Tax=Hypoxylon rubiginosum TaxID=110542 RepID=A0ACC0DK34_9PEZI|nr:hypothetical protein F4821DRAFT_277970 [Hypoxylon rubiginosum]